MDGRPKSRLLPHLPLFAAVETLWRRGTGWGTSTAFPALPTPFTRRVDNYCATNSVRALSMRSRKLRSRDICRWTLSTLWITVE